MSFFIVGITWVNHHSLFGAIAVVDRTLLFLNLLLLMFIVAIPFGTATLAAYLTEGGNDSHLAAAIYAAILEGAGTQLHRRSSSGRSRDPAGAIIPCLQRTRFVPRCSGSVSERSSTWSPSPSRSSVPG